MSAIYLPEDVRTLLRGKTVVYIGDSVQRSMYKDLVLLFQEKRYLTDKELRKKGEECFMGDELMEGGCKGEMLNSIHYREVRKYLHDSETKVLYFFITACFGQYIEMILTKLRTPDIIIMNSCLWDVHRYGLKGIQGYESNLFKLVRFIKNTHPKVLFLWTTTPPVDLKSKGGFLQRPGKDEVKIFEVNRCNNVAKMVMQKERMNIVEFDEVFYHFTRHRASDGVHWNEKAHRRMTNMILEEVSRSLHKPVPRITAPMGIDENSRYMNGPREQLSLLGDGPFLSHSYSYPDLGRRRWGCDPFINGRMIDDFNHSIESNYSYFESDEELTPRYHHDLMNRRNIEPQLPMRPPSGHGYRFGTTDPIFFRGYGKRKDREDDSPRENFTKRQRFEPNRKLSEQKKESPLPGGRKMSVEEREEQPARSDITSTDKERDEKIISASSDLVDKREVEKIGDKEGGNATLPAPDEKSPKDTEFKTVDTGSGGLLEEKLAREEKDSVPAVIADAPGVDNEVTQTTLLDDDTWSIMDSSYCEANEPDGDKNDVSLTVNSSGDDNAETKQRAPEANEDDSGGTLELSSENAVTSSNSSPMKKSSTMLRILHTISRSESEEEPTAQKLDPVNEKPVEKIDGLLEENRTTDVAGVDETEDKKDENDRSVFSKLTKSATRILDFLGKSAREESTSSQPGKIEEELIEKKHVNVASFEKPTGISDEISNIEASTSTSKVDVVSINESVLASKASSKPASISFYDMEYSLEDIEGFLDQSDEDVEPFDESIEALDDESLLLDAVPEMNDANTINANAVTSASAAQSTEIPGIEMPVKSNRPSTTESAVVDTGESPKKSWTKESDEIPCSSISKEPESSSAAQNPVVSTLDTLSAVDQKADATKDSQNSAELQSAIGSNFGSRKSAAVLGTSAGSRESSIVLDETETSCSNVKGSSITSNTATLASPASQKGACVAKSENQSGIAQKMEARVEQAIVNKVSPGIISTPSKCKQPCVPNPPSLDMKSPFYKPKGGSPNSKASLSTTGNVETSKKPSLIVKPVVNTAKSTVLTSPSVSNPSVSLSSNSGGDITKKDPLVVGKGSETASSTTGTPAISVQVKKTSQKSKKTASVGTEPSIKKRKIKKNDSTEKPKKVKTAEDGKKKTKKVKKNNSTVVEKKKKKKSSNKKNTEKNRTESCDADGLQTESINNALNASLSDAQSGNGNSNTISIICDTGTSRPRPNLPEFNNQNISADWNLTHGQHVQYTAYTPETHSFPGYQGQTHQYQQPFTPTQTYEQPIEVPNPYISPVLQQPQIAVTPVNIVSPYQQQQQQLYIPQAGPFVAPGAYYLSNTQYQGVGSTIQYQTSGDVYHNNVSYSGTADVSNANVKIKTPKKEYAHLGWM